LSTAENKPGVPDVEISSGDAPKPDVDARNDFPAVIDINKYKGWPSPWMKLTVFSPADRDRTNVHADFPRAGDRILNTGTTNTNDPYTGRCKDAECSTIDAKMWRNEGCVYTRDFSWVYWTDF
jgi:hypothetical protein